MFYTYFIILILISVFIVPSLSFGACSRPIRVLLDQDEQVTQSKGGLADKAMNKLFDLALAEAGCKAEYIAVPRARMMKMFFETKEADVIKPASLSKKREEVGVFVPLVRYTMHLAHKEAVKNPPLNLNEVLEKKSWKTATVRTYSYGDEWDAFKKTLKEQKRIVYVDSRESMFSVLEQGRVDFVIVPSTYAWTEKQKTKSKLKIKKLEGFKPYLVGLYLSKSLPKADLKVLTNAMKKVNQGEKFYKMLQDYYPKEIFNIDILPVAN